MNKKNLTKTIAAVAVMVFASMFGFRAAFGYGGGSFISSCSNVVYGEWGACVNGVQYRDVLSQTPAFCQLSASQQLARSQSCGAEQEQEEEEEKEGNEQQVLGEKEYGVGSLIRGSDKKVYLVVDSGIRHIDSMAALYAYAGQKIFDVSDDVIASYAKVGVLGEKRYGEGQLIRNDNVKVYVIENGKKKHILNLEELAAYYFGLPIYHVTLAELDAYEEIPR